MFNSSAKYCGSIRILVGHCGWFLGYTWKNKICTLSKRLAAKPHHASHEKAESWAGSHSHLIQSWYDVQRKLLSSVTVRCEPSKQRKTTESAAQPSEPTACILHWHEARQSPWVSPSEQLLSARESNQSSWKILSLPKSIRFSAPKFISPPF